MGDVVSQKDASNADYNVGVIDRTTDGKFQQVVAEAAKGSMTNISGTITTGGTAQTIYTTDSSSKYIFVANPRDATENLYVDFGRTADDDGTSYELEPGDSISFGAGFIPVGAVSVLAATAGHAFTAKRGNHA